MNTPTLALGAGKCEAHMVHTPRATYWEVHHIMPQAWQKAWWPPHAARDNDDLWDTRKAVLCRTGHGNVHFFLVLLMRGSALPRRANPREVAIARLGMQRWEDAGGSLDLLKSKGLLGYI